MSFRQLAEQERDRRAYDQLCRDVNRREADRRLAAEQADKERLAVEEEQILQEQRLAEHVRSGAWKPRDGVIVLPSPITLLEDPAPEQFAQGFQRLAWTVEEHVEYVWRHRHHDRPAALARVLERLGASLDDPKATIPADIKPRLFLDLAMMTRQLWKDAGWRQHRETLEATLRTFRNSGCPLMTAAEHETLSAMPDPLMIYRGFASAVERPAHFLDEIELDGIARGTSWTTHREIAEQFSVPTTSVFPFGHVASITAPKSLIVGYFRDEHEISVGDPLRLPSITIEPIPSVNATNA